MIVHCPSCSAGFRLALPPAGAVLRCGSCKDTFPAPARRRSYALAPPEAPPPVPAPGTRSAAAPAPLPLEAAPVVPPSIPAMHALDTALFAPPTRQVAVPPSRVSANAHREIRSHIVFAGIPASALVPLGLAALGAFAWFAAPQLLPWLPAAPFPVEPWMVGAAGAVAGLLVGGVWMGWRAARR